MCLSISSQNSASLHSGILTFCLEQNHPLVKGLNGPLQNVYVVVGLYDTCSETLRYDTCSEILRFKKFTIQLIVHWMFLLGTAMGIGTLFRLKPFQVEFWEALAPQKDICGLFEIQCFSMGMNSRNPFAPKDLSVQVLPEAFRGYYQKTCRLLTMKIATFCKTRADLPSIHPFLLPNIRFILFFFMASFSCITTSRVLVQYYIRAHKYFLGQCRLRVAHHRSTWSQYFDQRNCAGARRRPDHERLSRSRFENLHRAQYVSHRIVRRTENIQDLSFTSLYYEITVSIRQKSHWEYGLPDRVEWSASPYTPGPVRSSWVSLRNKPILHCLGTSM